MSPSASPTTARSSIKGGQIFTGYYNNDTATAEALRDGWFRTGDIGELDNDGCLRITGRKKELIVTAGGKNVAPAVLEDRLRAHRLISQCMVVGDAQPYIACLITLDEEALPAWLEQHGKAADVARRGSRGPRRPRRDPARRRRRQQGGVQGRGDQEVPILSVDWTEESGALTPSLKLKRDVVMKEYATEVDALYS